MAKRLTKEEKRIDNVINEAFKRHGHGVQVPIMSLPRIFDACRIAVSQGQDVDQTMIDQLSLYRVN